MYARTVKKRELTFGVSGMLWDRSLVMYDPQTNSLWSHLLGEAMAGPLKGASLEQTPSVMTDWGAWSKQHPDGTVVIMRRTANGFTRQMYRRLDGFVLGVVVEGKPYAWKLSTLAKSPVLPVRVGDKKAVLVFEGSSVTARLFERRVNGRLLTLRYFKNKLVDDETVTTWDPVTGKAVAGKLSGEYLKPLPAILSFQAAWKQFHPDGEIH